MTIFKENNKFAPLLKTEKLYYAVKLLPGGYGVEWDIDMEIPCSRLYVMGVELPVKSEDFKSYIKNNTVNAAEAAELLSCSRQNIEYLSRTGSLQPVKSTGKNTLFMKSDILRNSWI